MVSGDGGCELEAVAARERVIACRDAVALVDEAAALAFRNVEADGCVPITGAGEATSSFEKPSLWLVIPGSVL